MSFQRIHKSSSQSPQTSSNTSLFGPPTVPMPETKRPPTQAQQDNQAHQQHQFEVTGLQLKAEYGTITPVEQEKLGLLQAKMDAYIVQQMKLARAQPNILEILVRNAQSKQATESSAAIQPKLNIWEPNDPYEREADRVASNVVQKINTPPLAGQSVQREAMPAEEDELQIKPLVDSIQRVENDEEEELQMKTQVQRRESIGGGEASMDFEVAPEDRLMMMRIKPRAILTEQGIVLNEIDTDDLTNEQLEQLYERLSREIETEKMDSKEKEEKEKIQGALTEITSVLLQEILLRNEEIPVVEEFNMSFQWKLAFYLLDRKKGLSPKRQQVAFQGISRGYV
jgi:hypothetical protein